MSNLVTEDNDVEQCLSSKEEDDKNQPPSDMFLYLRELFFLLALVLTSYTALFNSLPKIGKPPAALPFFPVDSVVTDYYKGSITTAFQKASEVDFAVIMYYAPWDAESQMARQEFEAAAQYLHKEVQFAAVSCWSPTSECKQHFLWMKHFPVIIAYTTNLKGIQYEGPIESVYIINFVKRLMRPMHRIVSASNLIQWASMYNVFLVGSFAFSGNLGAPGYSTFYTTCLKILERDPYGEIGFGVTTNRETATEIDVEALPGIRLQVWNETYDYPSDADYTDESLVKWVGLQMDRVVKWVSPPRIKSRTFASHINDRPVLILFTPRNPLIGVNPMYNMLREIALRYHNCGGNPRVKLLANEIEKANHKYLSTQQKLEKYCLRKKRKKSLSMSSVIVPNVFLNSSKCMKEDVCNTKGPYSKYLGPQMEFCFTKPKTSYLKLPGIQQIDRYESFNFAPEKDKQSTESLLNSFKDEKCRNLEAGNEYYKLPFPRIRRNRSNVTVDGLACYNNRTLSIIAMDSLFHYQFAEGLGINILEAKDRTAVAIIDEKEESQYVLSGEIDKNSLMSFIVNHTKSDLKRTLRSSHNASAKTITRHRYPVKNVEECTHTDNESCVPELNSNNFVDFVMSHNKVNSFVMAVIVFYHTPYCAMCRGISHLFLLLSRYFRHFPGIKFARIDGDNNDLPWEYSMELFPALLFFPTIQKSESRLYSNDLPFTIRNLIHFVLANLEPEAKIPAMISLCISFEKLQNEDEARKCKSKIQKESYEHLSRTLMDTRRVMGRWKNLSPTSNYSSEIREQKKILLLKLDYFKTNHFLLGSIDKVQLNSDVVTDIIKLYKKFLLLVRSNSYYLNYDGFR